MSDQSPNFSDNSLPAEETTPPSERERTLQQASSRFRTGANGEVDVMHAVGGVRGIIEGLLPGFLFLVTFLVTSDVLTSVAWAGGVALVFAVVRVVQRGSLMQSFSGFVGVLLCALFSLRSGQAADYYLLGLWTNLGYGVAILLSILFRWPILGVIYGMLRNETDTWRRIHQRYRAYWLATWVLCAVFWLRLAVQVPLYLGDHVVALGSARLVMGTPLYLAVIWLTWMMTRKPADVAATEL